MIKMDEPFFKPTPRHQLLKNARGLAYAAVAPVASIARRLGCSETDAAAFQEHAAAEFRILMLDDQRAAKPQ